jgi:hypothetical protein
VVKEVLSHRWSGKQLEFTVKWSLADITTEPIEHVQDLEALNRYLELMSVLAPNQLPKPTRALKQSTRRRR